MRYEQEGFSRILEQGEKRENPCAQENLGTMMIWHARYQLFENPNPTLYDTPTKFKNNFLLRQRNIIALSLFYYSNTNTLSTSPKEGGIAEKVGWIYTDTDAIKKKFNVDSERIPPEVNRGAKIMLREEVAAYNNYVCSNVKRHGVRASKIEIFSVK